MCLGVCVCVCVCVSVCVSLSGCLSVCERLYMCVCVCACVCKSVEGGCATSGSEWSYGRPCQITIFFLDTDGCLPACLPACLPVYLTLCLSNIFYKTDKHAARTSEEASINNYQFLINSLRVNIITNILCTNSWTHRPQVNNDDNDNENNDDDDDDDL